jgi:hypothetical protein
VIPTTAVLEIEFLKAPVATREVFGGKDDSVAGFPELAVLENDLIDDFTHTEYERLGA